MGFRENLKNELAYSGMLVKELSVKSGVNKHTIDKYLREDCSKPSAELAIRIADALEVSVEYLISGRTHETKKLPLDHDVRAAVEIMSELCDEDRKMVLTLLNFLQKRIAKPPATVG
jgi:transcriptional regulator with XRE-family HTH domain